MLANTRAGRSPRLIRASARSICSSTTANTLSSIMLAISSFCKNMSWISTTGSAFALMVLAFQAASFARLIMAFDLAKKPAIFDGLSLGGKRRESRDDRKLRTSRLGRLWLFTHSAAANRRQLGPLKENPAAGRGLVVGTCPTTRKGGPDRST